MNNKVDVYYDNDLIRTNDDDNNEINIMNTEVKDNRNLTAPVIFLQNDEFELNNNQNQTIIVTKVINNNVNFYRDSKAAMADFSIDHQNVLADNDLKSIVGIFENDLFEMNNNIDQATAITKTIHNNIRIHFTSD